MRGYCYSCKSNWKFCYTRFRRRTKKLLDLVEKKNFFERCTIVNWTFWAGSLKRAVIDGDIEKGSLMAGQSVSLVKEIQSVKHIFKELIEQMENQINFEQRT